MSVKATENCIESLIAKGVDVSDVVVLTPTFWLDTDCPQSFQRNCASQVETTRSSAENWFVSFLECIDVTEAELEAMLTESEEDELLFDQVDCILQVITSVRFDQPQCSILRLQDQLQAKGLKIDVLQQNPILFKVLTETVQGISALLLLVLPLLQYVTIHHFQWQVMWLWELLVNIPIDVNTYEWLETLIKM